MKAEGTGIYFDWIPSKEVYATHIGKAIEELPWYTVFMAQATKSTNPKVKAWTEAFIKKYRPALKELSKK